MAASRRSDPRFRFEDLGPEDYEELTDEVQKTGIHGD